MDEVQSKLSGKRWRVVGATVTLVLLGVVLQLAMAARRDTTELRRYSEENLAKLKPGMTLNELEEILGPSRVPSEVPDQRTNSSHQRAWGKAIEEGKVQEWDRFAYRIQCAFPSNPSSDSKAVVIKIERPGTPGVEQKPRDKWMATKDSFVKLRVGMTLQELEDIIGIGEPAESIEESKVGEGWETAVKEYRVYRWGSRGSEYPPIPNCPVMMAGFPVPPSAAPAAKVSALSFRNGGTWDEDKGTLAGAHTANDRKD
jgi:hypothetical protein